MTNSYKDQIKEMIDKIDNGPIVRFIYCLLLEKLNMGDQK